MSKDEINKKILQMWDFLGLANSDHQEQIEEYIDHIVRTEYYDKGIDPITGEKLPTKRSEILGTFKRSKK
tara:strand:+ start:1954 stop:2163 length:210 start_codon:yes stop_codon:yes gene_type:complete